MNVELYYRPTSAKKAKKVVLKELKKLEKQRIKYIKQYEIKKEIAPELMAKVPAQLQSTLNKAFCKAFELIYQKGTVLIDKTYQKENAQLQYQMNEYVYEVTQNKKALKSFSKQSNKSNSLNLLISGVSGIGLGLVGCGLPDIPLFTSIILRSLYEISTHYGYDYTKPEEQMYQLLLIQGAMSYGSDLKQCLERLDSYVKIIEIPTQEQLKQQITQSAEALANEMLFLKFVQGIPVVGVVGGISDSIFLHRIQKFAKLNYQYRLLKKYEE